MRRWIAALCAALVLTGCTGTPAEQGSAPEEAVEYRIIEGSLPVTLLQVEELFAGEGMTDYTFLDSTRPEQAGASSSFQIYLEGKLAGSVSSSAEEDGGRMVGMTMMMQQTALPGVPVEQHPAFFRMACALYGEGMDAGALYDAFGEQLMALDPEQLPEGQTIVWLTEQQGEVRCRLAVRFDPESGALLQQSLTVCNEAYYQAEIQPRLAEFSLPEA